MKITKIVLSVCLVMSLITILVAQQPNLCPPCWKDKRPFSSDAPKVSSQDQRIRVDIRLGQNMKEGSIFTGQKVIPKYDLAINGQKNCRPGDPCVRGAVQQWNEIDPNLAETNLTPYYLSAEDPNRKQETIVAPIVIHRLGPGEWQQQIKERRDVCAYMLNVPRFMLFGKPFWGGGEIYLPYESINWSAETIACNIAHELGHTLGLADVKATQCFSIMNESDSSITDNPPCLCFENVTDRDRENVTKHFQDKEANCNKEVGSDAGIANPKNVGPQPTPTPPPGCSNTVYEYRNEYIDPSCAGDDENLGERVDIYRVTETYCNGALMERRYDLIDSFCKPF